MPRGEITISTREGQEYRVLYTNRALAEIEAACGKSIFAIFDSMTKEDLSITETAEMLKAGLNAARIYNREGGKVHSLNQAFDIMDEVGFIRVMQEIAPAIAAVFSDEDDGADPNG